MLTKGDQIEAIYNHLKAIAESPSYAFGALRSSWGIYRKDQYNANEILFSLNMKRLSKDSCIKYYRGDYYFFFGKVYEKIDKKVLEMAYEDLVMNLGIAPMMHKQQVRKDCFLDPIMLTMSSSRVLT